MRSIVKKVSLVVATSSMIFALEVPPNHMASTQWLKENLNDKNLVIIDTRKADDYRKGHIKGAVNYPKKVWFRGQLGNIPKLLSAPEHLDTTAGRMWTAGKLKIFSSAL